MRLNGIGRSGDDAMARRTRPGSDEHPIGIDGETRAKLPVRMLLVSGSGRQRVRITRLMERHVESMLVAHSAEEAREAARANEFDLAVIGRHQPDGCGIALAGELHEDHPALTTLILSDEPTLEDAVEAMRRGASDLVDALGPTDELGSRIAGAARRAQMRRGREERVRRLRRLCHHLNEARREVSGHVGALCNDLVDAYRDLSGKMDGVSDATELNSLLRQELDIECLLRTLLEHLLAKIGAVNGAIYLPSSSGDYSLGAYVNHDKPKDSAEVLFEHLGDTLAPRLEHRADVVHVRSQDELEDLLGEHAGWLEGSCALGVACCHEGECLAVLTLFRDNARGFDEEAVRLVQQTSTLFGAQLARVIAVHHRHLPEEDWGRFDPEEDDDSFEDGFDGLDLAA